MGILGDLVVTGQSRYDHSFSRRSCCFTTSGPRNLSCIVSSGEQTSDGMLALVQRLLVKQLAKQLAKQLPKQLVKHLVQ